MSAIREHDRPPGATSPLVLAMTGASGAPYAVRLLRVLCRAGRTVHLTVSPSGAQVLREEVGIALDIGRFDPTVFGELGPGRLVYHHHADFSAGIARGSVPAGGVGVGPFSLRTPGAVGPRTPPQFSTPPARRPPQGGRQVNPGPPGTPVGPPP